MFYVNLKFGINWLFNWQVIIEYILGEMEIPHITSVAINLYPAIKRLRMVNNGAMMAATGVTSFTLNGHWSQTMLLTNERKEGNRSSQKSKFGFPM